MHLLSDLASCGTSWMSWAGQALVTHGDCRHLADPELMGSLSGFGDYCRLRSIDWVLVFIPRKRFTKSNSIEIMDLEVLSFVVLMPPKVWA